MGVWQGAARVVWLAIQLLAGVVLVMVIWAATIFGPAIIATGSWPPLGLSAGEQTAAVVIVGLAVAIVGAKMSAVAGRKKEKQNEQAKQEEARLQEETKRREQHAIQSYLGLIAQELTNYKFFYPRAAEQSGLSGRVVFRFTVGSHGEMIDPKIVEVTGHSSFGDAALQVLKQIGPFPPFPNEIQRRELRVERAIGYRSDNRPSPRMDVGKDEPNARDQAEEKKTKPSEPVSAEERIRELAEIVRTAFQVRSCPRCYENKMALIEVSPTAASIRYACAYCRKEQRAVAISSDSKKAKYLEQMIVAKLGEAWFRTLGNGYRCTFPTPEATLPYRRRTRERIPEAIAAEVWRRDDGQCVKCESRENLHIDHITPLSQGGATIVSNLQVLCQPCNLSKGARI